jgi:hypothetical protein
MRPLLLLASALLLIFALSTSCKKQDEGFTRAMIVATNDITPTGCGYLLRFEDGGLVKPNYLASDFQQDSLGVLVKYYSTGQQSNCNPQNPYDVVAISEIKRDR